MSKKIVFVILWSTFLVALTGCAGGRRAKVTLTVGSVPRVELSKEDQEIKLRAKELELQSEWKKIQEEKKKFYTLYEKKARREIKRREKNERVWAGSRARGFLSGCEKTWISEDHAGPGSGWNPSVTVSVINNSGMDIKNISLSDRGPIVEDLCVGGSVMIHRNWNGNMNGINFSFMAVAEVVEGGTPRKYIWKLPASIYPNGTPQSGEWILTRENRQNLW